MTQYRNDSGLDAAISALAGVFLMFVSNFAPTSFGVAAISAMGVICLLVAVAFVNRME